MNNIQITLEQDEALCLFELLSRYDEHDELMIEDKSEEKALWAVHCALEKVLVEPFSPDYHNLLQSARSSVIERYGN